MYRSRASDCTHPDFQVVEIEVNSHCNLRCSYCPRSHDRFRAPEHLMDTDLFRHIIAQLAEFSFAGRLSFHMYNEPLLRRDLKDLVKYARHRLPHAWLVLYTNGDLLDSQRYLELLEAGMDHFLVTQHRGGTMPVRPFQVVRYPGEFMLSNRGGLMKSSMPSLSLRCFAPSEMLMIRHHGAVVLCHEDAGDQAIMGHVDRQTLRDIWFSNTFKFYRRALEAGDRAGASSICSTCDNRLHPLPDTAI